MRVYQNGSLAVCLRIVDMLIRCWNLTGNSGGIFMKRLLREGT